MPIEDLTTYTHALLRAKRVPRKARTPSRTNWQKEHYGACQTALDFHPDYPRFSPFSKPPPKGRYPAGSEGGDEEGQKRPTVGRQRNLL